MCEAGLSVLRESMRR